MNELTSEQQHHVIDHFKAWSGGSHPSETDDDEIETYVTMARDGNLDEDAVRQFLLDVAHVEPDGADPERSEPAAESSLAQPEADEADDFVLESSVREERRLARKPRVDHLVPGIHLHPELGPVPLFDVGDNIIVERMNPFLPGTPWLDTRVLRVQAINDDTGVVRCFDDEAKHVSFVGFKHQNQRFFLAPTRGNPFKPPPEPKRVEATTATNQPDVPAGHEKRGRGRPKGSKNRSKDVIIAEREAKRLERKQKRENRERRR